MTNTNNPSENNESITITPSEVTLTSEFQDETAVAKGGIRMFFFICLLLLLGIIGFMIYITIPTNTVSDATPNNNPTSEVSNTQSKVETPNREESLRPPFEESERQRARKKAQTQLAEFVRLQIQLEDKMNVSVWGQSKYNSVLEEANQADQRFLEESYDQALTSYGSATVNLQQLIQEGENLYALSISEGLAALAIRDEINATGSFNQALAIIPGDPAATKGLSRAKLIPEILNLILQSERAELQGDVESAHAQLESILDMDPLATDIVERAKLLENELSIKKLKDRLSSAFSALEDKNYIQAEKLFQDILMENPENLEALAGIQQTVQNKTLTRIQTLKISALEKENIGDWGDALLDYEAALEIDASLTFAREGKFKLQTFINTTDQIESFIADPDELSNDDAFSRAKNLITNASGLTGQSKYFDERFLKFEKILAEASTPISLILLSDNVTDVRINKIGLLGSFTRSVISLRPGRYTVVGSRDGCRDVRKTIVVSKDMDPVTIACSERI